MKRAIFFVHKFGSLDRNAFLENIGEAPTASWTGMNCSEKIVLKFGSLDEIAFLENILLLFSLLKRGVKKLGFD